MKFMLMGFEAKGEWERLPQAERDQRVQRHQQALQELIAERGFVDGRTLVLTSVGLAHSAEAITLRTEGGRSIADEVRYAYRSSPVVGRRRGEIDRPWRTTHDACDREETWSRSRVPLALGSNW